MNGVEIGPSSVHRNLLTQRPESILKRLRRSAILGQHLDIFHIPQNCVNTFASPREISNSAACSMNLQIRLWRNRKLLGIRGCECYSRLPTRVYMKRTSWTKFIGVRFILETQLKLQLTRRRELLTDWTGSNQRRSVSNKLCTSWFSVKIFSRRWIPLPLSSLKAFLYPKRSRTAHTLDV